MVDPSSPFYPEDDYWPEDPATRPVTFTLWLEFELWQDEYDPEDGFFHMTIHLSTGQRYALNVWTLQYLATALEEAQRSGEKLGGKYLVPPDLLVERLDRKLMEEIVADLIRNHGLRNEWLSEESEEAAGQRN